MELEELFFPPLESRPLSSFFLRLLLFVLERFRHSLDKRNWVRFRPSCRPTDSLSRIGQNQEWKISSEHLIHVGEETNTEKSDERNDRKLVGWRLFLVRFLAAFQFVYLLHLFLLSLFSSLYNIVRLPYIPSLSGTCVTMENCHTRSPIFASVTLHHLISLKKK